MNLGKKMLITLILVTIIIGIWMIVVTTKAHPDLETCEQVGVVKDYDCWNSLDGGMECKVTLHNDSLVTVGAHFGYAGLSKPLESGLTIYKCEDKYYT